MRNNRDTPLFLQVVYKNKQESIQQYINMQPWKPQKIDMSRGPAGNYRNLRKPLDMPPKGMEWQFDERHADKWILKHRDVEVAPSALPSSSSKENENVANKKDTDGVPMALVEGVDYLKHTVLHDVDTFQGLCIKYKINAIQLRQANGGFSGTNLRLAAPVLYIPLKGHPERLNIRAQDTSSMSFKLQTLLSEFPRLRHPEAKAYLELADGDLEAARKEAKEDLAWEEQQKKIGSPMSTKFSTGNRQEGVIHVHVGVPVTKTSGTELEMRPLLQQS